MQKPTPMTFERWMSTGLVTYAACQVILVAFAGLALYLPFRSLMLPYAMLLCCGLVLVPLIYWARQPCDRPKSCAIRLALAIFFYLQLFMLALAFSVAKVGILPQGTILNDYAPYILPAGVIASIVVYVMARKRLEDA